MSVRAKAIVAMLVLAVLSASAGFYLRSIDAFGLRTEARR
jgi:hypothetical protein